ncbi:MAG: glycosyltransferase [Microthrixaceae bacterium]|nr:glycosyltransferase [Microthrixaceae bacterium]
MWPVTQRFSVVLPVRNRADSVGRAAVSVLAQTFGDVELVVADAASSDGTLEAVRTIADDRVRVVHGSTTTTARAAGIRTARGEWVAVIDADTVARPQWLARVGRLVDRTGADVVCCGGVQHHWDHSTTEVLPTPECTRPGAFLARRVRPEDPHVVTTPELLLDWHEATSTVPASDDERRLMWATDAIAMLGDSPLPAPDLLVRYATLAGVSAARLHRHREARHMLAMARSIQRDELRCWARWAVASVPPLADLLWPASG